MGGSEIGAPMRFPTIDKVIACVPKERHGYILAAWEFSADTRAGSVKDAIDALAEGHELEKLVPPLPEQLGSLIVKMSRFDVQDLSVNADTRNAARLAVITALDHSRTAQ